MSIDALLERLTQDAEAQARELVAAALERARALEAATEAERAERLERDLGQVDASARQAVARETAIAERAQRLRRLEERARVLDLVFARAEELLRHAPVASYEHALEPLLEATTRYVEGPVRLRCPADAAPRLGELVGSKAAVALLPDPDAAAGILAESDDGRVRIDNTLVARLTQRLDDLAPALLVQIEGR